VQDVIENAITSGPFGDIAKQNIEFMRSARDAFIPKMGGSRSDGSKKDDVNDLKRQIAELQARIDKLDKA
jgi:polyhydroxyalkanoate synthesis regulator protein